MSLPVNKLRQIVPPSRGTRGVVVAVENGVAKVATLCGLKEYRAEEDLPPGAALTINAEGALGKEEKSVYWM